MQRRYPVGAEVELFRGYEKGWATCVVEKAHPVSRTYTISLGKRQLRVPADRLGETWQQFQARMTSRQPFSTEVPARKIEKRRFLDGTRR